MKSQGIYRKAGKGIKVLLGLAVIALIISTGPACSEKEVPFVVDADEIARYIREDQIGRELFTTENLILNDPYVIPYGGDTVFIDSVVSVSRSIIVDFPGDNGYDSEGFLILGDYGSLGKLREAWAEVIDDFTVKTTEIIEDDTSSFVGRRTVVRKGFFLKLGDDAEPFVGWVLWGWNAIDETIPLRVTFKDSQNNSYPVDYDFYDEAPKTLPGTFVRLSEIEPIILGSKVVLQTTKRNPQVPVDYIPHITAAGDGGYFNRHMIRVDIENFVDTIDTPDNNPFTWNVIHLQVFKSNQGFYLNYLVIPYKVE